MRKTLDGDIRLAPGDPLEGAEKPCRCEIGIKHQCLIDQGNAAIEFTAKVAQSVTAPGQRDRVVLAELHGTAGQARAFL